MAGALWHRVMDALYAQSDASHRARGWEVRKGQFGARRYRLDVAAWLESQRRDERFGSTPSPVVVVRDEAADLWDSMRWTEADIESVLGLVAREGRRAIADRPADVPLAVWMAPRCGSHRERRSAA